MLRHEGTDIIKLKGVTKKPSFEEYRKVLFTPKTIVKANYLEIGKKDFGLYTRTVQKSALNALNDKFLYKDCRIHGDPYGMSNFNDVCTECPPSVAATFQPAQVDQHADDIEENAIEEEEEEQEEFHAQQLDPRPIEQIVNDYWL